MVASDRSFTNRPPEKTALALSTPPHPFSLCGGPANTDLQLPRILREERSNDPAITPASAAAAIQTPPFRRRSRILDAPLIMDAPSPARYRSLHMQNIEMRRQGEKLVIEIDLSKDFGPSASGKTVIVASTRGNAPVPDAAGIMIGINCFRYTTIKPGKAKTP